MANDVKKIPEINDNVIVTDDDGETWRIGELTNIDCQYFTVGFHNPNTGDAWIDIYDTENSSVTIEVC